MKNTGRSYRHAWLLLYFAVYLIWFYLDEKFINGSYAAVHLWIDAKIPFCEYFIVPYTLWYPFLAFSTIYLFFKDEYNFCRYMWAFIIGFSFCLAFYIVYPNGQDLRPQHFDRDNVFIRLVTKLYATDTNLNVFPSMHVYGTLTPAVALLKSGKFKKPYQNFTLILLSILICISTVFIKQHSVVDVLAGVALYLPIYWMIYIKGLNQAFWIWPAAPLKNKQREPTIQCESNKQHKIRAR